jgi:ubiquinone/menaquinone biosynthesis C-methylase UbiE
MSFSYISAYDSPQLHGSDDSSTQRPWDLNKEILSRAGKNLNLLDIGCGSAFKLIPLSPYFGEITGLDISEDMIVAAKINVDNHKINNINLIHADSNKLPFEESAYDMVTCMLSRWNENEIFRILKPNGVVIIEHIGCEDKKELKILFGKDKDGWRGQFIEFQPDEYLQSYQNKFKSFNFVSIKNGFWRTHYTEQGLLDLLRFTPTIRNFNESSDNQAVKNAFSFFKKPQGIELTQNRILIHAKKP